MLVAALSGLVARAAPARADISSIRHVFVIVLENQPEATTFGPGSPAPYLASTLPSQGAFVPNYFGIGHHSNDNYIAMISGQAPNPLTQGDCPTFADWPAGSALDSSGQQNDPTGVGGCVYPANVPTIASQLNGAGLTWRDYNADMGNDPAREAATCGHPAVGSPDNTEVASPTDQYATRHNPFVYFHSIIDNAALCNADVVNLNQLPSDLSNVNTTPNYTFISPNLCDDGHDHPCANGQPGGLVQANAFLQNWVPQITSSPAFRQNGLLIVTFDESDGSDSSSCCGEIPGPNAAMPGINGPGGGNVGTVLLSPCIAPGTVTTTAYNHYSMLRSVEDMFGLPHLAYAGLPGETSFGSDVFNRQCGSAAPNASINAPPLLSKVSTRAQIPVSWSADTTGGTPLSSYTVQVLDQSVSHPQWQTLLSASQQTSLTFGGHLGHTYKFQVQAVNTAGQTSGFASVTSVIPSGARPFKGHFSRGWRTHHVRGAWQGKAIVSQSPGATFKLRFVGGNLNLIGETTPAGGAAKVTVDGHSRTIHLHSSRRHTERVLYAKNLNSRVHHLTVKVLRGTVALEGVAITARTG